MPFFFFVWLILSIITKIGNSIQQSDYLYDVINTDKDVLLPVPCKSLIKYYVVTVFFGMFLNLIECLNDTFEFAKIYSKINTKNYSDTHKKLLWCYVMYLCNFCLLLFVVVSIIGSFYINNDFFYVYSKFNVYYTIFGIVFLLVIIVVIVFIFTKRQINNSSILKFQFCRIIFSFVELFSAFLILWYYELNKVYKKMSIAIYECKIKKILQKYINSGDIINIIVKDVMGKSQSIEKLYNTTVTHVLYKRRNDKSENVKYILGDVTYDNIRKRDKTNSNKIVYYA